MLFSAADIIEIRLYEKNNMKIYKILITSILITFIFSINKTNAQKQTEVFEFDFKGNKLSGLIESPDNKEPSSLIILVPGSGRTNFVEGNWYYDLRSYFVSLGISCCFWDKAGCGNSEGDFDPGMEQPISKSADEISAAINELKKRKVPGSAKIGLWGISRAGWVCPWVIKKNPDIAFWISLSSPDDNDQSVYQLKSNLIQNGYSEEKVKLLTDEYWKGETIFQCGGSYEDYCTATKNMRKDSICSNQSGKTIREDYYHYQKLFLELDLPVDCETGRVDGNPGFKEAVSDVSCPVLAIFGENDSYVNWRNTVKFYNETIGSNGKAELTIKTFPNCSHGIQKCRTGAIGEDLSEFGWAVCEGYPEAMKSWLLEHDFIIKQTDITKLLQDKNFSGTVLIEKNDSIIYHKSFGLANQQFSFKNTNDTKYHIASITKLFTSVLIFQLYEEGKIDLSKTIQTYLPEYKGEGADKVTIDQLLTHTSGIQNCEEIGRDVEILRMPNSSDDIITKYCSGNLVFQPGTQFSYNNADYMILGKIIENVYETSFEQVLTEKILEPLKLGNTGIIGNSVISNLANAYLWDREKKEYNNNPPLILGNYFSAGAMYSTPNDLLNFTEALFQEKLISKETLKILLQTSSVSDYWAHGLEILSLPLGDRKLKSAYRQGGCVGTNTSINYYYENDFAVIILANTDNIPSQDIKDLNKEIVEMIME